MRSLALSKYAVGFRRTLDHLRAWPIQLPPQLKETVISFHTNEKGHSGLRYCKSRCVYLKDNIICRLFIYQHLPQLKYHNPNVLFKVIRNQNPPQCSIQFVYSKF